MLERRAARTTETLRLGQDRLRLRPWAGDAGTGLLILLTPGAAVADSLASAAIETAAGHGYSRLRTSALSGIESEPFIRAGFEPCQVVTLSSGGHRISDVDLDDPNFEHTPYDPWVAYGRSKTANIHFAAELARRFDGELLSLSVHPGAIPTKLGRHMTKEMIEGMRARAKASSSSGQGLQYKTLESGAATQVWAATAAELADQNGKYLADCNIAEPGTGEIGYAPHIYNPPTEAALWELSERLVDLSV